MIQKLDEITPHLLSPLKEHELVSLLRVISRGFTSERERIEEYVSIEEQVSAYTAYFLPTNIPKLFFLLEQLPEEIRNYLSGLSLMDVGSGPGTYSLGWSRYFNSHASITLVDQSKVMLKQAKSLLDAFALTNSSIQYTQSLGSERAQVVLFGNSLNEMGALKASTVVKQVAPEFGILIEPGTKQSFAEVLKLRSELLASGFVPLYPCRSAAGCPLDTVDDWCHQVLRMTHEAQIERISQLAQLDRKIMPFIAHIYRKAQAIKPSETGNAHFLRFLNETKFSFLWQVCLAGPDGKLATTKFEIMKKDYPKSFVKRLERASVGEHFTYRVIKELEGLKRIQLLSLGAEFISE